MTGPPGSGKSTVSRLLLERFPRGIHISGFAVVVDDTLGPGRGPEIDVSQHADLLEDATAHCIAPRPRLDVVVERNRRRGGILAERMDQAADD